MIFHRSVEGLQDSLNFIMFKTQIQRLCVIAGGYGFITCLYGLPRHHSELYVPHFVLGVVLLGASIVSILIPRPRWMIVLGVLLIVTGIWINVMAAQGEAAGGSLTVFSVFGIGLSIIGAIDIADSKRFAYLAASVPSRVELENASMIIRRLLSANPKKRTDVLFVRLRADSNQFDDQMLPEHFAALQINGTWKVKLLPNAAILLRGSSAQVLVLQRSDFGFTESDLAHLVVVENILYFVTAAPHFADRLQQWLLKKA